MGRRRLPGRFSREWQRERAAQAQAEADEAIDALYRFRDPFGRSSPFTHPSWRVTSSDKVLPYRGFRNGRGRTRPDETGYDDPVSASGPGSRIAEPPAAPSVIDSVPGDE
jgi:hypothetical protein